MKLKLNATWCFALAVCAATSLAAQSSYRYGACSGTYDVFSSGATASAGALSMPVGTPVQAGAAITMGQCGREMVLVADGMAMTLYQDVMDDRSYVGTLNAGDGVVREVTLRVGDDRNLRGALVASDANMSVTRPLWFMLTTPQDTRFEDCKDDAQTPFRPRGLTPEAVAVIEVLAAQGLTPAEGLSYSDYIAVDAGDAQSANVRLRVSQDGALLPRPEIAAQQLDPESAFCTGQQYLDPAHQILEVKVQYADDDPFVFARLIDIATSQIVAQAEGVPAAAGNAALTSGTANAWAALAPPVTAMTDGVVR